ncbi:ABC transporter permease [Prauserella halophila]|uniref:ABC transporter permease n=1 Tax=Prauserella halophila TaxID=185641 RepID=UPI0020A55F2E|nr:ABC transporter permease [Prauserella halophila]
MDAPEHGAVSATRAIVVIAQRDLIRQVKHPGMLVSQAMQMVFIVVIFGVGFNSMIRPSDGLPFSAYVFPGIIAIQVVTVGINSGLGYAWDREFGVLREMLVAPAPKMCLPVGKIFATGTVVCVQSAIMLLLSPILEVPLTPAGFAYGTAAYTFVGIVFSSIGLLLATAITRIQTLQSSVSLATFPMLFLSGSVFRPDDLPAWLSGLITVNPMSYGVDLVRHLLLNAAGTGVPGSGLAHPLVDFAVLCGFLVAGFTAIRIRVGR